MINSMKMRNIGYFADFAVFPVVLAGILIAAHRYGGAIHGMDSAMAIFAGIFLWTFLEYAIHRFILHKAGVFSAGHAAHHAEPKAMIGTPTWLTLSILVFGIYLPGIYLLHAGIGLMFGFGVTFGYLVYSFAHYTLHHWNVHNDGVFHKWKRIHALHHFVGMDGNFGVTSTLWDHVFGTAAVKQRGFVRKY